MQTKYHNHADKIILVAEDEDLNYLLIQEIFKKNKVKLIRAKTGRQVIDIFKENSNIDLILMDIKMPEINGYEATRIIKEIRDVPIIAQTAYAMAGEENKSKKAGCDEYITKPININKIRSIVEKYLNR